MIALFRVEFAKATKRTRTLAALGLAVGIPILVGIADKARGNHVGNGDRGPGGDGLFRLARQTGLVLPGVALTLMSAFFLVVIVAMFAGDTIAGEAATGNLRYLLLRPVRRGRLLAAKSLVAFVYAWLMTIAVTVSALVIGVALFGWHPVNLLTLFADGRVVRIPAGLGVVVNPGRLVLDLLLSTAYVAFSMSALVAIGVFFSTITDSAAGAIAGAVGVYIVSDIFGAVTPLGVLRYGLPTWYSDAWQSLFEQNHLSHDMLPGAIVQVVWTAVFLALAGWWFARKDIAS
ncbi:MAG TPA: ABC transporter permease subunit [Acidimicrobiia bacterium]